MYCGKCGSKLESDADYCPYCGTKISNEEEKKQPEHSDTKEETVKDNKSADDSVQNEINHAEKKNETKHNDADIEVLNSSTSNNENVITYNIPQPDNSGLKIASLILGIISIVFCLFNIFMIPFAIAGICLGIKYKNESKKSCPGFVVSIIGLVLSIVIFIAFIIAITFFAVDEKFDSSKNKIKDIDIASDRNYDKYYDKDDDDDEDDTQVIGNRKFGYLTIPSEWTLYKSSDGSSTLQYSYNNKWVLSLYAIENPSFTLGEYANSIHTKMQGYGASNVTTSNTYVGKYQAIKKSAYLSSIGSFMTTWCFADESGNLHYIAINGPTRYDDIYDVVNTYKLF